MQITIIERSTVASDRSKSLNPLIRETKRNKHSGISGLTAVLSFSLGRAQRTIMHIHVPVITHLQGAGGSKLPEACLRNVHWGALRSDSHLV